MRPLRLAPRAQRDLAEILETSEDRFGARTADRYRRLFAAAFRDLSADPGRVGVRADEGVPDGIRLYHLRYARPRVSGQHRIVRPRHFIVFREVNGQVRVVRILHDSMDLERHL